MFEAVIGLEFHAQLRSATKLFCGCRVSTGEAPNTRTCPVCLGLPGTLPVLNTAAVDHAILAALALQCRVNPVSVFARKNYFYPDLPKGYQITQYDQPLAEHGLLAWSRHGTDVRVGIIRLHLEEDAGKSQHDGPADGGRVTGLDFNRAGVPLAEIVTAPDLTTPEAAAECFRQLRAILVDAGVCDGNLEAGNIRCDANVSVRPSGAPTLGTRIEIKNLNSFRFVQRALEYEIQRQTSLLLAGTAVEAGTRQWDERAGVTVPMRAKEDAREYRYFPDPDLPPLVLAPERVKALAARLPELPAARAARLAARYALGHDDAVALAASADVARYFEAVAAGASVVAASQWVRGELTRRLNESGVEINAAPVSAAALARLLTLVDDGAVSVTAAKQVFSRMWSAGGDPEQVVQELGLGLESDPAQISAWVEMALAAHPDVVAQYRAGRRGAVGFLVGQALKTSGGRANPRMVDAAVRERLEREDAR